MTNIKEDTMLVVTEAAQVQVAEYFKEKEIKPIRIFLNQSGCGGSQLAMAIDSETPNDKVFTVAGIDYLVNRDFLKEAQPIQVSYNAMGFAVTSTLKLEGGGCSGCGSSSNCCS